MSEKQKQNKQKQSKANQRLKARAVYVTIRIGSAWEEWQVDVHGEDLLIAAQWNPKRFTYTPPRRGVMVPREVFDKALVAARRIINPRSRLGKLLDPERGPNGKVKKGSP